MCDKYDIPNYCEALSEGRQTYIVYNIHEGGKYIFSRRYADFRTLHEQLQQEFKALKFPSLPSKWLFNRSDSTLSDRRKGLIDFLNGVSLHPTLYASESFRSFLSGKVDGATEISIHISKRMICQVSVKPEHTVLDVYDLVQMKLGLNDFASNCFALFEIHNSKKDGKALPFLRKLDVESDKPLMIWDEWLNSSKSHDMNSCLALRKWIFTTDQQMNMLNDDMAVSLLYFSGCDDIEIGRVIVPEKMLSRWKSAHESCSMIRCLYILFSYSRNYNVIEFPSCDYDESTNVTLFIDLAGMRIMAENGKVVQYKWNKISSWRISEPETMLYFEYTNETDHKSTSHRIFSPYYKYINDCILRVISELRWGLEVKKCKEVTSKGSVDEGQAPRRGSITQQLSAVNPISTAGMLLKNFFSIKRESNNEEIELSCSNDIHDDDL